MRTRYFLSSVKQGNTGTALSALLMLTAESMSSKRPVLKFTAALFFLQNSFVANLLYSENKVAIAVACTQAFHFMCSVRVLHYDED